MNIVVLPPTPGTVAAYLRVSSLAQRHRETIASQREAVLEHAGGRGWTVPKERVFADDGFSGATLDRPALEALRDAVAGGEVETVLAWSADRLSRNFAHQMLLQEEFARHGARIVFVQEPDDATPQGMLLRQMLSAISEYERTQIAERSRRGKIHRARQGSLNMISRPPYGYRLIRKTEACGARLEIDEAEAAVVRRIYDLYVREGLKMHAVSRRLDAEGIRPRHAERWPTATVAVVLRNETYVGRAAYLKTVGTGKLARRNRTGRRKAGTVRRLTGRTVRPREEWIELPVPAIVEAAVFARAQRRRAENRRFSPRKTADPTLLQGLCVCTECGYTIGRSSGNSGKGSHGKRIHYYRCHGIDSWRRPQGAVCDNPPVRADELDAGVWREVLALLENPQLVRSEIDSRLAAANDTASNDRRMATLRAESSRNQTRMRRLLDAYQEGLVTLDELRGINAPMQTRQRAVLSELDALRTANLDRSSQLALATTVARFLKRMREAAGSLAIAERQRIVRLLVREVRIGKESVTICHSIPLTDLPPAGSQPAGGVPAAAATHRSGLLVPRCGQIEQGHRRARVEQLHRGVEQVRLDGFAMRHQRVRGAVQLHRADGLEVHAQQLADRAAPAQPAVRGPFRGRERHARDDRTERRVAQRGVDAERLQQGRQPQLRERPQGDVLRADAAWPHQGQGVDRHRLQVAGRLRVAGRGRLRAAGDQLRDDALRLALDVRRHVVEQVGLPRERRLDALAERGPAFAVDVEVAAEVEQGALADAATVAFGAHQAVGVVAGAVGLTGLGAADEHGGDVSGGRRRVQDPKFILWHYICSGGHAPTKNQ